MTLVVDPHISGHSLLYRINHGKKSIYCGKNIDEAAKKFYEAELEGTEDEPVEWWIITVCKDPLVAVGKKLARKSPGGECLTARRDDT